MKRRLFAVAAVLAAPLGLVSAPASAQSTSAMAVYPGGTTAVAAPPIPTDTDLAAREGWIAECGRRLDAVNEGRDGPEPFRSTCAAWLDYFQRAGVHAKEAYANPPAIPVTMVPLRVMVPCKPTVVEHKVPALRHHYDKRVRLD
jgi:hypothetical protein